MSLCYVASKTICRKTQREVVIIRNADGFLYHLLLLKPFLPHFRANSVSNIFGIVNVLCIVYVMEF